MRSEPVLTGQRQGRADDGEPRQRGQAAVSVRPRVVLVLKGNGARGEMGLVERRATTGRS